MTLLEEQNKIWNPSSLAPLQLLSWSFCIEQAASLRSLMSIELLEERGLCRGGLWSPCPSVHEHAAPLTLGSGWCQPSGAVTWAAACSSPAWLVFTLGKSTSPAAARGFGMSPELRVAKCCVCLQWELKSLSYPTQSSKYYCFPLFLTYSCPWTSTTLRMTSTSSRWCWSQGTPNLYVIFYCFLTYCLFCLHVVDFIFKWQLICVLIHTYINLFSVIFA